MNMTLHHENKEYDLDSHVIEIHTAITTPEGLIEHK